MFTETYTTELNASGIPSTYSDAAMNYYTYRNMNNNYYGIESVY